MAGTEIPGDGEIGRPYLQRYTVTTRMAGTEIPEGRGMGIETIPITIHYNTPSASE